jgi:hypothetical protein
MNAEELRSQLWAAANEIDTLRYRIENAGDVLEVMAVAETSEPQSGALWFVRDSLKTICQLMEIEIDKVLEVNRQIGLEEPKKKKAK